LADELTDPESWCRFGAGTTQCLNGDDCSNPNHVEDRDPWSDLVYVKRDRWGRYMLPDPVTGEEKAFTRMTTAAGTLDDKYGLIDWKVRRAVYGVGQRDDLRDLAASADGPDDRKVLDDVVKQAEAVAESHAKANVGTALHGITEKVDRGDKNVRIPEAHRDRITRYKTAVAQHGLRFIPELTEVIVVLPELGVAGMPDRVAWWPHSELPVIYDLKTGSIEHSKVSIAQQESGYAHSTHWFDGKEMRPMPAINLDVALVLHLPSDSDAEPKLYSVNIKEGWNLLNQSMEVRTLRTGKGKHLFTEITADAIPTASANREEELRVRVRKIVAEGHQAALKGLWADDVPTLKEGGLTAAQLDRVESWCEQIEREKEMPF
jgi:hypothetical protein